MNRSLRTIFGLFPLFLVLGSSQSLSQNKQTDLPGYQDFKWGMSMKTVFSMLMSQKASIKEKKDEEIITDSKIELDGFPPSIDIEKSFIFLNGKLGEVMLRYHNPQSLVPIDSIYVRIDLQLRNKYGDSSEDTTMANERVTAQYSSWKFPKGFITLYSVALVESSDSGFNELAKVVEMVTIIYGRKGIDQELDALKKKRTEKQF